MKIRIAQKKDSEQINNLNEKLFDNEIENNFDQTLDKNWVKREGNLPLIENPDGIIFVAEDNNKIIGYLAGDIKNATSWRNKMKIAEGESMFVSSGYRSQGIGSKLFEEFFRWAKEKGATRISLTASFANEKAIKFYKKLGFKEYDLVLEKEL